MSVSNHEVACAVESLGARLKRERERQKITLDDVAIATYLAAPGPSQPIREPEAVLSALAVRAEESRNAERPSSGDLPWDKLAAVLLLVAFDVPLLGWRTRNRVSTIQSAGDYFGDCPGSKWAALSRPNVSGPPAARLQQCPTLGVQR